ncbi:MAG TPA: hypothetical protein VJ771_05050 [Candidatus Nitrosotalea sp.]|nr:hypothetical protein [Candidatus Nitrosotalea sp.]
MNKKYVGIIIGVAIVIGIIALSSSYSPPSTTNESQNASVSSANQTVAAPHKTYTVNLNESVGITTK